MRPVSMPLSQNCARLAVEAPQLRFSKLLCKINHNK